VAGRELRQGIVHQRPPLGGEELVVRLGVVRRAAVPGVVGEVLAHVPLQDPEALAARGRREPAAHRGGLAQRAPVLEELQPRRLDHVVRVPRAEPEGAGDAAQEGVESGHQALEGVLVPGRARAHDGGELGVGLPLRLQRFMLVEHGEALLGRGGEGADGSVRRRHRTPARVRPP
jgi:hypothetical protein